MQKLYFFLGFLTFLTSCKNNNELHFDSVNTKEKVEVSYSKGFIINKYNDYQVITLNNPWPGSETVFRYALVEKGKTLTTPEKYDAVIKIPVENIVVTSTTHIPSLEMLGVSEALVGFPNLNYVSSEKTRNRINDGQIVELGKNEDINTEVLIDLSPDMVVGFAVDGNNSAFKTIQATGIPVVYNSDWTETSPLGKAEWIKFFGALFNKQKEADSIFNAIEKQYNLAKQLASQSEEKPSVLSGAMYKDVWYLPQGGSWAAQFIADAHGDYLWKETEGTGSLSLNLESVLEKGKLAEFWIGPGQFTSLEQMKDAHGVYTQFRSFENRKVFSSTNKKGATGGVLYYELAPNRPDLVLKDIIKILHPELLLDYEPFFFSHLE